MVKKYIILVLFVIILFSVALLVFYPVSEVSGYLTGGNTMYYSVHSNGIVEYYMNYYVQQLIDDGADNCPHVDKSIVASKYLNPFQKFKINKYINKIKDDKLTGNYHSGTDGAIYMCVKIDDVKYYSDPYEMVYRSNINEYSEYELPDVIDLSTFMWYIKPSECDEYWSMERNSYPPPDMSIDNYNGVLSFYRNHHNRMVEKAEYLNSISK